MAPAVISGDVHVGFCGPEATMYVYDNGEKDYLVSFAGLTKRDGQFIVSRKKIDNFTLDSLKGKEVLAGRRGGMPIVNFYNALEKENITGVNVNDSVDFANLTSAFVDRHYHFLYVKIFLCSVFFYYFDHSNHPSGVSLCRLKFYIMLPTFCMCYYVSFIFTLYIVCLIILSLLLYEVNL